MSKWFSAWRIRETYLFKSKTSGNCTIAMLNSPYPVITDYHKYSDTRLVMVEVESEENTPVFSFRFLAVPDTLSLPFLNEGGYIRRTYETRKQAQRWPLSQLCDPPAYLNGFLQQMVVLGFEPQYLFARPRVPILTCYTSVRGSYDYLTGLYGVKKIETSWGPKAPDQWAVDIYLQKSNMGPSIPTSPIIYNDNNSFNRNLYKLTSNNTGKLTV
jgi:hypothetical protein